MTIINQPNSLTLCGFKSKNKIDALMKQYKTLTPKIDAFNSYFPLKQNVKKYALHKVASRNTYLIDLMFEQKFVYLVAININTRYLFVELMNKVINPNKNAYGKKNTKTTAKYIRCLENMMINGMSVNYLSGDSEKCFTSNDAQNFYFANNITFIPVERLNKTQNAFRVNQHTTPNAKAKTMPNAKLRTSPNHNSLGIIDRVIRTIRDMAYHMEVNVITPQIMHDIVLQYNSAPHQTLSYYAGFGVSPKMVNDDAELENYIVRKICQENYNIKSQYGFDLAKGTKVKIYNEKDPMIKRRSLIQPGDFEVDAFTNGMYRIKNTNNNKIIMLPRTKIAPIITNH